MLYVTNIKYVWRLHYKNTEGARRHAATKE